MSLIYGKIAYNMEGDIYQHYDNVFRKKECLALASHIEKFFNWRFPHIVNLMSLISIVGWIALALERPVFYSTPVFTTIQDYMKSEVVNIWIYDRPSKKRRQKDANIIFYMIRNVKSRGIPIYTVHDNFITTPDFSPLMAGFYIDIFKNGPHPMEYINAFILQNLVGVKCYIGDYATLYKKEAFLVDILHNELLSLEPPELYKKKKEKFGIKG
ncbi:putative DNA-directed RNA polymerase [Nicotiana tabacum]|uniref:DNA-directed RNA polymerase n=1 Tax=Nicotiana tabacum TaxID=4097 RepID=A0AC58RWX1_TOBAC